MESNIIEYYLVIIRTNIIIIAINSIEFNWLVFVNIVLIIIIDIVVIMSHTINIIMAFIVVAVTSKIIAIIATIIIIIIVIIMTIIIINLLEIYQFSINNLNSRCFMLAIKMKVCFSIDFQILQLV